MVKVTALLIWLPVEQSRSVGEQKRRSTKSEVHHCLMNVCMLVTLLLSKNHGDQWPHQACIVQIDTENKLAMIQWETT